MNKLILILILLLQTLIVLSQNTFDQNDQKKRDKYFAECILEREAYSDKNDSLIVYIEEIKLKHKKEKKIGVITFVLLLFLALIK